MWIGVGCPCPPVRNDIVTIVTCLTMLPSGELLKFGNTTFAKRFAFGFVLDFALWKTRSGAGQFWKCHSNKCKRKKVSDYTIYSRAISFIYIVINREKEKEEKTPIHYYKKGRGWHDC